MYLCKKCDFTTESNTVLANHYKYDHNENTLEIKCVKCNKNFKTKGGLKIHEKSCNGPKITKAKICPKCNFLITRYFEKHYNYCDGRGPRRKREKVGHSWSKGLTKYTDDRLLKISEFMKNRDIVYHTDETKKLLSDLMKKRYESGWESTAGRCKKIDYNSPIAGEIKVDGKWELNVAIYLDKIGVKWNRNKKRFKYINTLKDKISTYCPDFYVDDWNCFIEVKGYITELDRIKWSQFTEKIEIWDKNKLNLLGIDTKYKKKTL